MLLFLLVLICTRQKSTIWCTLKYPASLSKEELAQQLCHWQLLKDLPLAEGLEIAADCAFNHSSMAGKIIRPLRSNEFQRYVSTVLFKQSVAHVSVVNQTSC